jgi:hypothetical protein
MNLKQRKKDISKKLEYLGTDKKIIKDIISLHYSVLGRLKKEHIKLEDEVNYHYNSVKSAREEYEKAKIKSINFYYNFYTIYYN